MLEGLDGVLIVGGDEDQMRNAAPCCDFEARQAGHADVEKGDVGSEPAERVERRRSMVYDGDDVELGPLPRQPGSEIGSEKGLVVGDQCAGSGSGIHSSAVTPVGWFSRRTSSALAP